MDEISKSLGLAPLERATPAPVPKPKLASDKTANADKDYAYARENFYNVIEKGTYALEEMLEVAKASEHPRAYEVVSTIMKTLVDANKDLVSMSDKKADAEKEPAASEAGTVNNNLFVGSTAELQQVLRDMKNEPSD
jgi:hypothetical protein